MLNQFAPRHGDGLPCNFWSYKWIAVAIAADPGTKLHHLRQIIGFDFKAVLVAQRAGDFFEELRQGFKDRDVVIVEAEFDFVLDRRAMTAYFVGLPERGDFREDIFFASRQFLILQRNLIETFQGLAEASPLEQDGASGDLRWMSGEHRDDANFRQKIHGFAGGDAGLAHAA